ncbi:MAG: serine hydrolase [Bacteroidota bacterium]
MPRFTSACLCFLSFFWGTSQNPDALSEQKELDSVWQVSKTWTKTLDSTKIVSLIKVIEHTENGVESLLIAKKDTLLMDTYFKGYAPDVPHDLRSVTKGFISILIGIAVDKGLIEDINDPIQKYLGPLKPLKNKSEAKSRITLKHLLTMSSGWDCNDWDKKSKGQEDKVYRKKDWLQYTMDLPMVNEPGQQSAYCTMGTVLLGAILEQVSEQSLETFAHAHLFEPLSISNYQWGHTSKENVISSAKRLYLTPRDMAKIGILLLNQGKWDDQQIVSRNWVGEMTKAQTQLAGLRYGYLWWNIPFSDGIQVHNAKVAMGNGGQYIIVLPDVPLVIVFTGNAFNSKKDKLPLTWVQQYILPAIKS